MIRDTGLALGLVDVKRYLRGGRGLVHSMIYRLADRGALLSLRIGEMLTDKIPLPGDRERRDEIEAE